MTVFTNKIKGGGRMDSSNLQYSKIAEQNGSKQAATPVVDWSEETVIVNGQPIIVMYPDETKRLDEEN